MTVTSADTPTVGLGKFIRESRFVVPTHQRDYSWTDEYAQSVPVKETHAGAVVWEGVVHVFDLAGHPTTSRAYAGRRQSRAAISAGASRCSIRGRLDRQRMRCARRSS